MKNHYKQGYAIKRLTKRSRYLSFIYAGVFLLATVYLVLQYINNLLEEKQHNILAIILAIGFFITALVFIIKIIRNSFGTGIQDYFLAHPDTRIEEIDRDISQAIHYIPSLWTGRKCTYHIGYLYPYIIENKELVWVYITRISGRGGGWSIHFCDLNKKMTSVTIKSEKKARNIVELYKEKFEHMVVGFSRDLEDMYNSNLDKFLELKYRKTFRCLHLKYRAAPAS